jgi:UDP-glucose 4-epimerase
VTGGAGFIGSHLAAALVARGHFVRVLDDLSTGSEENVAAIRSEIELVEGDCGDDRILSHAMAEIDVVFHHAAAPSVALSIEEPLRSHEANATATLAVLDAAVRAKVRRLVFASSSSVYGQLAGGLASETSPVNPLSPYAAQKLFSEHYLRIYSELHKLETISLRYFNVFGPRQDPSSPYSGVISIFCQRLLVGQPVTIFGDGEQTRDFTYVDNVVQANLLSMVANVRPGCVVNVATGRSLSINQLYDRVALLCGSTRRPRHEPARAGDIRISQADISAARECLGYEPRHSFENGLEKTLAWFRARTPRRKGAPTAKS